MASSAEPTGTQSGQNPFPQVFGKYVLLRPMARGGMGELFLAAAGETGGFEKLCAVKKVLTELDDGGVRRRFLDEAKVVVRLNHANLVQVFDAGRVGEEHYLAMELVEGKDLRRVWNRCAQLHRRIPVDFAIFVVREMCRALDYVHDAMGLDLVHRDISPPNIMISYHGQIKVTDFGLATHAIKREFTNPGVVFGRYSYLSPEQARGLPADRRTDIYASGIVLWEMLTGRQLFPADRHRVGGAAALQELRNPTIRPPSEVVPGVVRGLDEVVLKALAVEREERYQTAGEFKVALADILARHYPTCDVDSVATMMREIFAREYKHESQDYASYAREDFSPIRAQAQEEQEEDSESISDSIEVGADGKRRRRSKPLPNPDLPAVSGKIGEDEASAAGRQQQAKAKAKAKARVEELEDNDIFELDSSGTGTAWDSAPNTAELAKAAAERVGEVVGKRYRVDRLIGVGAMGAVFACTHLALGKTYALKILHEVYGRDPDIIDRFVREARAATQTGHPNIIDVLDIGTMDEGDLYFVMELLEGTDLHTVVRQSGPMAVRRAVHVGRQICRALTAAHEAGIIHRDLKSENVMLTVKDGDPDFVKVLDFGICKQIDTASPTQTSPGMVVGSPAYMAPEQAAGAPADIKSDIYALGTILFEMLTGRLPFTGKNAIAVLMKKGSEPAPEVTALRPDVPPPLAEVVARCLEQEMDARPESMKALEYELTRAIEGRASAVAALMGLQLDPEAAASAAGSAPHPEAYTRPGSQPSEASAGQPSPRDPSEAPETIVTLHDQAAAHSREASSARAGAAEGPSRLSLWLAVGGVSLLTVALVLWFAGVFESEGSKGEGGEGEGEGDSVERVEASDSDEPELPPDAIDLGTAPEAETSGGAAEPVDNDPGSIIARAEQALADEHWREPLAGSLASEISSLAIVEPNNEAIGRLRKAAKDVLDGRGRAAIEAEDWGEAVVIYRDLLAVWPDLESARDSYGEALRALAREQRSAKDYEALLGTADELLAGDARMYVALRYRADALAGLERWEEAVPAYRAAMRIRPSNREVKKGYWNARQKLKQAGGVEAP